MNKKYITEDLIQSHLEQDIVLLLNRRKFSANYFNTFKFTMQLFHQFHLCVVNMDHFPSPEPGQCYCRQPVYYPVQSNGHLRCNHHPPSGTSVVSHHCKDSIHTRHQTEQGQADLLIPSPTNLDLNCRNSFEIKPPKANLSLPDTFLVPTNYKM